MTIIVGGLTGMTTSADSQTTSITYDSLRRRSTTTYPTTTNVVTTYTYDNLNRTGKRETGKVKRETVLQ